MTRGRVRRMDLTSFLLARIAEDEAAAAAATQGPWQYDARYQEVAAGPVYVAQTEYDQDPRTTGNSDNDGAHIARHDPTRVLHECETKRQIVNLAVPADLAGYMGGDGSYDESLATMEAVLVRLALPYADHPDYRDEWKP
jgi:hypothetical protein